MRYSAVYAASAAILFGLCAISLLPLLVLFLEFHGEFCNQPFWFYIAKFYGSYFLFPIFGVLAAAFLVLPFATLWLISKHESNKGIRRRVVYTWVGLVLVVSALEFTGSPHAIFEVSPQALRSADGQKFYTNLKTICTPSFAYKGKYDGAPDSYQSELSKALSADRSYSGYVYFVALPAQAASLIALLCGFGLIAYFKKPYITSFLAHEGLNWEKNNIFLLFGLALSIGSLWCLYRISYRIDNIDLFGSSNNPLFGDYVVLYLYLLVLAIYVAFVGFDLEKIAKTTSQLAAAAAVVGLSLAAPSGFAGHFFGVQASVQNIGAVLIVLLILVGIGLLLNNDPPPPLYNDLPGPPLEEEDG
jgi:uncharacterized membrane protein